MAMENELIKGMKTPDEIKKGLGCCASGSCTECPYDFVTKDDGSVVSLCPNKNADALAYIQQLESDNAQQARCIENLTDKLNATNDALPKWISAKEPPKKWKEDGGDLINYLVYMPEYGVDVGNYIKTAKMWLCMGLPCKVTHWMPLPEPPKCKENGGAEDA